MAPICDLSGRREAPTIGLGLLHGQKKKLQKKNKIDII